MNHLRFLLAYLIVITPINAMLRAVLLDSAVVIVASGIWCAFGMSRVFHRTWPGALSMPQAFKGMAMVLAWPLTPKPPAR